MTFVYTIVEELKDLYGDYTGEWSEPKQRSDYIYHPNGYEYFFPQRRIHGMVQECNCINFGYDEPQFSLARIQDAISYAVEHGLVEETMILLRAAHELGVIVQGGARYAL